MVIQHNISALNSWRNTNINTGSTSKNLEKLSSGFKINRSADDAAGLAISEKMRGQIRGLSMAEMNVKHGINLIQTAEGGMEEIGNMLQRQRELIVQSLNGTYADEDRELLQREIDQLTDAIDGMAVSTKYNNVPLLAPVSDIVFALDITGSMSGQLNNVRNSIGAFLEELPPGSRISFVLYRDISISQPAAYLELTSDVDEINKFLASVNVNGGGDTPESGLEAIVDAIDRLKTSPNNKHVVFITDAVSHTADTTGKSSYTVNDVNNLLKGNDITFHAIGPTSSAEHNQFVALGAGTGGTIQSLSTMSGSTAWYPNTTETKPVYIQSGANKGENIRLDTYNCSTRSLGTKYVAALPREKANQSLLDLDDAINTIGTYRANCGASQNRLEHALNNLGTTKENLQSAESTIRDVDMAKEMMEFTKHNILVQASQSMLAQANQLPQGVLSLLK